MSVVTLEDLQGSIEVVVFPRLYEQTGPIWQEGAILLVAGRVDHRGEEVSLLADVVVPWDEAVGRGPESFAREVAAGERGSRPRRQPVAVGPGGSVAPASAGPPGSPPPYPAATVPVSAGGTATNGNGHGYGRPNGFGPAPDGAPAPAAPGFDPRAPGFDPRAAGPGRRPDVEYVSPLRGGAIPEGGPLERPDAPVSTLPRIAPAEPVSTYAEIPGDTELVEHDVEPALPDEARTRLASEATAATDPLEAVSPGSILHVRFGGVPAQQLVSAMETFRQLARERPGETPVIVHVPAPGGSALPMELRTRIAYDADLLAEVQRRLGIGIVDLRLA
jgi:hypothetical protein